ncbi:MAG: hypothetical protein JSR46_09620 [Verrucomicrobia bacterium]|nr:hypothetical protein [Verrucomicrobiota bacterium]
MAFLDKCNAILQYATEETFSLYYKKNDLEKAADDFTAPLKLFTRIENDPRMNEFERFSGTVMRNVIGTPLAFIGAWLKQQGEATNPGKELRQQVAEKESEMMLLEDKFPEKNSLKLVCDSLSLITEELRIRKILLDHLEKEPGSENSKTAKEVIGALNTPLFGQLLVKSIMEKPEVQNVPVVQKWFLPHFKIVQKVSAYVKEDSCLDFTQEAKSMVDFAKEVAPEDAEWHKAIESFYEQTKALALLRPLNLKLQAVYKEMSSLQEELRKVYK